MNVLKFELAYFSAAVEHFSHNTTVTLQAISASSIYSLFQVYDLYEKSLVFLVTELLHLKIRHPKLRNNNNNNNNRSNKKVTSTMRAMIMTLLKAGVLYSDYLPKEVRCSGVPKTLGLNKYEVLAQSAGVVEYTDCTSVEVVKLP